MLDGRLGDATTKHGGYPGDLGGGVVEAGGIEDVEDVDTAALVEEAGVLVEGDGELVAVGRAVVVLCDVDVVVEARPTGVVEVAGTEGIGGGARALLVGT